MNDPALEVSEARAYDAWRTRWLSAASAWTHASVEVLGSVGPSLAPLPVLSIRISSANSGRTARRVALTAGIHGDEPAGVDAVTQLLEAPQEWGPLLAPFDVTIFPCANPTGLMRNHRANREGIDLNRTFDRPDPPLETAWIRARLAPDGARGAFDTTIEFHEDSDAQGFYLYELAQAPPYLGNEVINAVASLVAIDARDVIEGLRAQGGVIRPDPSTRSDARSEGWPQALFCFQAGIPSCLTLETPSRLLPIERRARVHLAALKAVLCRATARAQSRDIARPLVP